MIATNPCVLITVLHEIGFYNGVGKLVFLGFALLMFPVGIPKNENILLGKFYM